MNEDAARQAVVAEALTWLRTPYAHRQQLKGVAVDCAQLPLAVYAACDLIPPTDVGEYAAQWHMHRGEERYLGWVEKFATEIDPADVQAGDFLVWKFGRVFSHGAIAIDAARVIHAVARAGKVIIENRLTSAEFRDRPCKAFSPWTQPALKQRARASDSATKTPALKQRETR